MRRLALWRAIKEAAQILAYAFGFLAIIAACLVYLTFWQTMAVVVVVLFVGLVGVLYKP